MRRHAYRWATPNPAERGRPLRRVLSTRRPRARGHQLLRDVFVHDRADRLHHAGQRRRPTAHRPVAKQHVSRPSVRTAVFDSTRCRRPGATPNRENDVSCTTGHRSTPRVSVATGGRRPTALRQPRPTSAATAASSCSSPRRPIWWPATQTASDVFLHDRGTGATTRVSVATGGGQASHDSSQAVMSYDGRYVAFTSLAVNLVAGDSNRATDVFVHDRATGATTRVSVATGGFEAKVDSFLPDLSGDGRFVAFASAADLVAGDTNGLVDVFVHDRLQGTTTRTSIGNGGVQATGGISRSPALSADGRYVAFESGAPNLAPRDANMATDVFVHDTRMYQRRRISISTGGGQASSSSLRPSLSAEGRYVAFESYAPNLVAGDTNGEYDVFVHDRVTGETTRVSVATGGRQATGRSLAPSMSGDGRYVAFESSAPDLVPGDTNGVYDVFVHDRVTGETTRVSVDSLGTQAAGLFSSAPALSADGRYVAFMSAAPNLVAGDTNNVYDVFVHDRVTGDTTRASVASGGGQGTGGTASSRRSVPTDGTSRFDRRRRTSCRAIPTASKTSSFTTGRPAQRCG